MKNDNFKSFAVLTVICIVVAALMGIVNSFTSPVIQKIEAQKVQDSLKVVMPQGEDFQKIEVSGLDTSVTEVYKERHGGYVFKLCATGYASNMIIMCGVDSAGNVTGAACIASGETLEYEKTYGDNFVGVNGDTVGSVDTISGATLTTNGYKTAIKTALEAFGALTQGE